MVRTVDDRVAVIDPQAFTRSIHHISQDKGPLTMGNRNYKTGTARNRRSQDPAGPAAPQARLIAVTNQGAMPGVGTIGLITTAVDPVTGLDIDANDLILTGRVSTYRCFDATGQQQGGAPTLAINGVDFEYTWTGLPAGTYVVTSITLDPSIRAPDGSFLAPVISTGVVVT